MSTQTATACITPSTRHQYDTNSQWCIKGCGNRADGRTTTRDGIVITPGTNDNPPPPLWSND